MFALVEVVYIVSEMYSRNSDGSEAVKEQFFYEQNDDWMIFTPEQKRQVGEKFLKLQVVFFYVTVKVNVACALSVRRKNFFS